MRVSAVIPNWNGRRLLEGILADIQVQSIPFDEVIVVDNGSTDDSREYAASVGAKVVCLGFNRGFAAAVNRGVAEAFCDGVAILNNDVRLRPDWLEILCHRMEVSGRSFATGKILMADDPSRIDGTFDAVCRGGTAWRCGHGQPDGPAWAVPREIAFSPFTAVLLLRAVFLEVGGLDETFGTYLEDVDFGLRCASKGYTGWYAPEAVAMHSGSATWGRWNHRTVRQIARNQVLLVLRHYPLSVLLRFGWPIAIAQLLWGLVALRHGAGFAWLAGKLDGLRLSASVRRIDVPEIARVLGSSETLMRELQRQTGRDWYWRIYFTLTSRT